MEKYPIQALAIYDPNLSAITTSSSQLFRVNKWSHQYVVNEASSGSNILVVGKTASGDLVPVSVNSDGTVNVAVDTTPGIQKGSCTAASGLGYIPYDDSAYVTLDSISMTAGQTINVYGFHSMGNAQAMVELIIDQSGTITKLLVGTVSEGDANWDPFPPVPIEVTASNAQNIILRIKGLRQSRSGQGTGRIFGRLV